MATTAPTYIEFMAQYTGFSGVPQPVVERQLFLSGRLLDDAAWGDFYSDAVGLDSAHNLSLALLASQGIGGGLQGVSGPTSSVSAAGVSISFESLKGVNDKNPSEGWYAKTVYGQQFLRLRNAIIPAGVMAS